MAEFETQRRRSGNPTDLLSRLERIRESDNIQRKLGLDPDVWHFPQLKDFLRKPKRSERYKNALIVLGSYVDVLDTRTAERQLVADRLSAFERDLNSFLLNKKISLSPRKGIVITTGEGAELREDHLRLKILCRSPLSLCLCGKKDPSLRSC